MNKDHEHELIKVTRLIPVDNPNFNHTRRLYFVILKCTVEGCKYEHKIDMTENSDGQ